MSETVNFWYLGSTRGKKVIHRHWCRHARTPYNWAGEKSEQELVEAMGQSVAWHRGGLCCAKSLAARLVNARAQLNGGSR